MEGVISAKEMLQPVICTSKCYHGEVDVRLVLDLLPILL